MSVNIHRRLLCLLAAAAATLPIGSASQVVVPRAASGVSQPDALITLIRSYQRRYVRESFGTSADQCFTDVDLVSYRKDRRIDQIVKELSGSRRISAIVSELKAMSVVQQEEVLDKAGSTFRPTWAQLGKIDRAGQTEAGQIAEREIAEAIAGLARAGLK